MNRFLAFIFLLLFMLPAFGATTRITASLTFTNTAGTTNGQTITVNGNARTYTNSVSAPLTQILTNSTATGSKTNTYNAVAIAPFSQVSILDRGATNIDLVGASGVSVTVTLSSGWGSVTYSTQTVAQMIGVRVPIGSEPSGAQQTNIASSLVLGIDTLSSNAFHESSIAVQNLVGITNAQTITGNKTFTGTNVYNGGTATNIVITNAAAISGTVAILSGGAYLSPSLTNGQNYGNAFRSPGSASFTEQFGSGATATALGSVALGYSANASNLISIANGYQSIAGGAASSAYGESAQALETGSTAIGAAAIVAKGHTNSIAIGVNSTTTTSNQIRLGTISEWVSIPGSLRVAGSITNAVFADTNNFPAGSDIAFGRSSLSSLANGNNAGIVVGTNVFIDVSGPSGAFTVNGIAGGRDGKLVFLVNLTTQNMTIAHDSGVDPTAANRIYCMTGADRATTGNGVACLIYNANISRWILWNLDP